MVTYREGYTYKDYGKTKVCSQCNKDLAVDKFELKHDVVRFKGYLVSCCKNCRLEGQKRRYHSHRVNAPFKHKVSRIRAKAKGKGVPFNLTQKYLESIWTGVCPVYGTEINIRGDRGVHDTAELDRFIPELGYVKGNVTFLSRRANAHKNDMSLEEVEKLKLWMEKVKK